MSPSCCVCKAPSVQVYALFLRRQTHFLALSQAPFPPECGPETALPSSSMLCPSCFPQLFAGSVLGSLGAGGEQGGELLVHPGRASRVDLQLSFREAALGCTRTLSCRHPHSLQGLRYAFLPFFC